MDIKSKISIYDKQKVDFLYHKFGYADSAHAFPFLFLWQNDYRISLILNDEAYVATEQDPASQRICYCFPCGSEQGKVALISEILENDLDAMFIHVLKDDLAFIDYFSHWSHI